MQEPQQISSSANIAAISWTGGKDCNLALLHAWRNPSLHVTSLVCFRPRPRPSSSPSSEGGGKKKQQPFLAHPIPFMQAQADALGLPLLFVDIPEGTTDYMKAYVDGLTRLRADHGVTVIVTGDMDLIGTMERNWMQRCCEGVDSSVGQGGDGVGMQTYLPLWQMDRSQCLRTLLEEGFSIIFTCVKSPFFDKSWIGRRLDEQTMKELECMAAASSNNSSSTSSRTTTPNDDDDNNNDDDGLIKPLPLDVCGERGEYHTMCIDGPLYRHPVRVEMADEPAKQQDLISKTKWKGNIHNTDRLWTISLKGENDI